jgi:hypothetical protein
MNPELSDRIRLPVEPSDIAAAHERISAHIRRTPIMEVALAVQTAAGRARGRITLRWQCRSNKNLIGNQTSWANVATD